MDVAKIITTGQYVIYALCFLWVIFMAIRARRLSNKNWEDFARRWPKDSGNDAPEVKRARERLRKRGMR